MLCRYYLMIGKDKVDTNGKSCIDVSGTIANSGNIRTSYERPDLGGVIRKCGSTFEFTDEAREWLIDEYRLRRLKSLNAIAVHTINNDWTYKPYFECPLDISTFTYDSHIAKIGCMDNSAAALIKANKSTVYEYPVSELKEDCPLNYDGVRIRNEAEYSPMGESVEGQEYKTASVERKMWWWFPRLGCLDTGDVLNKSFVFTDQEEAGSEGVKNGYGFPENKYTGSYFCECVRDCIVSVDFTQFSISETHRNKILFVLFKIGKNGDVRPLTGEYLFMTTGNSGAAKWTGKMMSGEKLQFGVCLVERFAVNVSNKTFDFRIGNTTGIASWNDVADPLNIDVITPYTLLNRILSSINGDGPGIFGSIKATVRKFDAETSQYYEVENERLNSTLIVPAEAVRGIKEAKVYSSFSKFCDFMESVFGYVYSVHLSGRISSGNIQDILNKSVEFQGFTGLGGNVTSLDANVTFYIKFSSTDREFIGITVYGNDRASRFTGFERFQEYVALTSGGGDYKVREDIYFHDTTTDIYYYNRNTIVGSDGKTDAGLHEYELPEIYGPDYSGLRYFSGILITIDAEDGGTFTGNVDTNAIFYVRTKKKFMFRSGDSYYGVFDGSSYYNMNGKARTDVVFVRVSDGSAFVIIGTSLIRSIGGVPSFDIPESDDDKVPVVTFRHRDEVFSDKSVKTISLISEPEYSVAGERIYAQVQIGYEKQDYDIGNNGNDEFNFSGTYTTGHSFKESKLALLCPFRADCYGFEELAQKTGEETSSTDSDQQTFIVKVETVKVDDKYVLDRSYKVEGAYTDTVFNAVYAPVYMIEANKKYLGSFAEKLTFASSEGNSSIVINGRAVNADVVLDEKLFEAGNITVETNDFIMPGDWNETVVSFVWDGCRYTGYLSGVDIVTKQSEILKYKLIEKEQLCLQ